MKREKRKTADASPADPSLAEQSPAGDCPLSTQDSALSTASPQLSNSSSAPSPQSSVLSAESSVLDVFCPQCGYNLRGIDSSLCPECGYSIDFRKLTEPQLPWLRRSEIGSVRAYWRTVRTAIVRKKKFWEELSRPVSYRDAQHFRWITVLLAYVPLISLAFAVVLGDVSTDLSAGFSEHPILFISGAVLLFLCLFLFLAGATGVPSYFFHPRRLPVEQQNRAVALSYYCCAPLAWLAVVYVLVAVAVVGSSSRLLDPNRLVGFGTVAACVMLAFYLCCRIALEWPMALCSLHKCATQSPSSRYGLFFLLLPMLWLGLACVVFVGIPAVLVWFAVVVASLW